MLSGVLCFLIHSGHYCWAQEVPTVGSQMCALRHGKETGEGQGEQDTQGAGEGTEHVQLEGLGSEVFNQWPIVQME